MSAVVMEQICTPIQRFQDVMDHDWDDDNGDFRYTEVKLTIPVEYFLSYRWDWKDLQAFLTGGIKPKLLWITERALLVVEEENRDMPELEGHRYISADIEATSGLKQVLLFVQLPRSDKPIAELCVFWNAVATCNSVRLTIKEDLGSGVGLPPGFYLSHFLEESPSLEFIKFDGLDFMEEHCRTLVTLQRTDLKVSLKDCNFCPQDAEEAFL
jgi:hypothetical protein